MGIMDGYTPQCGRNLVRLSLHFLSRRKHCIDWKGDGFGAKLYLNCLLVTTYFIIVFFICSLESKVSMLCDTKRGSVVLRGEKFKVHRMNVGRSCVMCSKRIKWNYYWCDLDLYEDTRVTFVGRCSFSLYCHRSVRRLFLSKKEI
jgi:hypothetical protein